MKRRVETIAAGRWTFRKNLEGRAEERAIIELDRNGDPFGGGFVGSESTDGGKTWFYRGDVGAAPRRWWRAYARRTGAVLREVRS